MKTPKTHCASAARNDWSACGTGVDSDKLLPMGDRAATCKRCRAAYSMEHDEPAQPAPAAEPDLCVVCLEIATGTEGETTTCLDHSTAAPAAAGLPRERCGECAEEVTDGGHGHREECPDREKPLNADMVAVAIECHTCGGTGDSAGGDATRERIAALGVEARAHGDYAMATLCDRATADENDEEAWLACEAALIDAEMAGGCEDCGGSGRRLVPASVAAARAAQPKPAILDETSDPEAFDDACASATLAYSRRNATVRSAIDAGEAAAKRAIEVGQPLDLAADWQAHLVDFEGEILHYGEDVVRRCFATGYENPELIARLRADEPWLTSNGVPEVTGERPAPASGPLPTSDDTTAQALEKVRREFRRTLTASQETDADLVETKRKLRLLESVKEQLGRDRDVLLRQFALLQLRLTNERASAGLLVTADGRCANLPPCRLSTCHRCFPRSGCEAHEPCRAMRCYSDHDEDIRTKGSCDYCRGTANQGAV